MQSSKKQGMKFYNLLIKYRLHLGILLLIVGGISNYYAGFWPAFPAYLIGGDSYCRTFLHWPASIGPNRYGRR